MEAEGKMSKFKGQMIGYETRITDTKHNAKCQSPNGEISGRAEKRALSANQRFFRQVLGTKERPRRFLQ